MKHEIPLEMIQILILFHIHKCPNLEVFSMKMAIVDKYIANDLLRDIALQ